MPFTQLLRSTSLAVAASTVIAAPAFAGGFADPIPTPVVTPVVVAPPVVRSPDWGGGYVGLEAYATQLTFEESGDPEVEFDGSLYGIFAGYRFDFGRFVAGGELAYNTGSSEIDGVDIDQNVWRAGVQLGFDAGRVLPYITAGYANLELDAFEGDFDGSYAGVGVDVAVTDRFTVGAQYLLHSFDDAPFEGVDADLDALGIRAAYNF